MKNLSPISIVCLILVGCTVPPELIESRAAVKLLETKLVKNQISLEKARNAASELTDTKVALTSRIDELSAEIGTLEA